MSKQTIFRSGSIETEPFAASLPEVHGSGPRAAKNRSTPLEQLRENARTEGYAAGAEQGLRDGLEQGTAAGLQAGFDQAHAEASAQYAEEIRAFTTELQKVHNRLEAEIEGWFRRSEEELSGLSLEIAEQLLGTELQTDRSYIVKLTKDALRQVASATQARIRLNPFDSTVLRAQKDALLAASATLHGVELVDDESIRAGCIIETDNGVVDATLDTRLTLLHGNMEDAA